MRGRRAFGGLPLFGTAAAGVVIGHWLSYQMALPDTHLRHHVLLASGHGHWLVVVKVAVAFALAGLVTLVVRFGRRTSPTPAPYSWAIGRLALVQAVAFTSMEVVERLGIGAPVAGMFAHHLFALGLAVQLLVACAGGSLLVWISRAVRRMARAFRARPSVPAVCSPPWRPVTAQAPAGRSISANEIRGPPRS
jgi:hypothetical protein